MKSSSVLFVGCGDVGIRTGALLLDRGWRVEGVRRNTAKLPPEIVAHAANYTLPGSLDFLAELRPEFVVTTFNPTDRSVDGYKDGFETAMGNLLTGLGPHRPRHIVMASSTRVFAEANGGWVDEGSALTQKDLWAQPIIAAEQQLLNSDHAASVVRFAGIYGLHGGRLLSRIRRGELCPPEPESFTNRIHRDDCAGLIAHLLQQAQSGEAIAPMFIGVDDLSAPRYEVESWLATELGVANQSPEFLGTVEEPTRHNTDGHKRCRNTALRESGYQLLYPDYKRGYGAVLDSL